MFKKLLPFIIFVVITMSCSPVKKEPVSIDNCGDCQTELNEALKQMDNK